MTRTTILEQAVREQLDRYFADLGDAQPRDLLSMVLTCAERPVLQIALERTGGNQSRAAEMLGITRATLRRKLIAHEIQP